MKKNSGNKTSAKRSFSPRTKPPTVLPSKRTKAPQEVLKKYEYRPDHDNATPGRG